MLKTRTQKHNFSSSLTTVIFEGEKNIKLATYKGSYFVVCIKCPHGLNHSTKIGKYSIYKRKGNYAIELKANQINNFKKNHDVGNGHKWTILHESTVPKYVSKQMIGGNECLIIAV